MKPMADVYTNIFYTFGQSFVKETEHLHPDGSKSTPMDGYTFHVSYKTLSLLRDNNIFVAGFPLVSPMFNNRWMVFFWVFD